MGDDTAHSVYGASSADRWFACPGSIERAKRAPERAESFYAREGTVAHALGEYAIERGLRRPPEDLVGSTLPDYDDIEITEEMLDAVEVYAAHCAPLWAMATVRGLETKFDLTDLMKIYGLPEEAKLFGTSDFWTYDRRTKTVYVRDYKHGQGVAVPVEWNRQQLYYALGALDTVRQKLPNAVIERVQIGIVQPRGPGSRQIKIWDTTPDVVMGFADELADRVRATFEPDAPLETGDHCRWCPALATCPKAKEHAMEKAKLDFDAITSEPQEDPARAVKDLTGDELAEILDATDYIRAWLAAVQAEASHRIDRGQRVPGWKHVAKRAMRKWVDGLTLSDIEELVETTFGGPADRPLVATKLLSPAQMERALGREFPKAQVKNLIGSLVTKDSTGTTLVRDDDPRDAVETGPQSDFGIVEDEIFL